ncbi:MAG: hypothetical protein AABY22_03640 [Nanoarchaeota archaeon]
MKLKQKQAKDLLRIAREFLDNSQVPKNIDDIDPRKDWIIDNREREALKTVIKMAQDCMESGISKKILKNI